MTKANKLTLQSVELPQNMIPGKLEVTGQGAGCVLLQVRYNKIYLIFYLTLPNCVLANCVLNTGAWIGNRYRELCH